jgi:hypothetical protein
VILLPVFKISSRVSEAVRVKAVFNPLDDDDDDDYF